MSARSPYGIGQHPHDPYGQGSEGLAVHEILVPSEPDPGLDRVERGLDHKLAVDSQIKLGWFDVRHGEKRLPYTQYEREQFEARFRRRVLAKKMRYKLTRREERDGTQSEAPADPGGDPRARAAGGEDEDPEVVGGW